MSGFESPSKLGPQHNLHITNMESPSRYQHEPEDVTNSSNGSLYTSGNDIWSTNMRGTPLSDISSGSNAAVGDSAGGTLLERGSSIDAEAGARSTIGGGAVASAAALAGSTNISIKVIEALHGQVDTLSSTNLQLTKQYQDVLNRLKEATDRESALAEEVSKLQVGNLELNSSLEDRSNEVKQREQLFEDMKNEYNALKEENTKLEAHYKENAKTLSALNERYDRTKAKKNALLSLQEDYKQACDDEMETVRNKLDTLETKIENFKLNEDSLLDELDSEQHSISQEIESDAQTIDKQLREQKARWDALLNSIDLETLSSHYQASKSELLDLAEKLDVPVVLDQDNYVSIADSNVASTNTRTRVASKRKPTPDASKRSSFYGVTSPLVNQGFKTPHAFSSRTSNSFLPGVKKK